MKLFHVKQLESATRRSAVDHPNCRVHTRHSEVRTRPVRRSQSKSRPLRGAPTQRFPALAHRSAQRLNRCDDKTNHGGRGERRPRRYRSGRAQPQPQQSGLRDVIAPHRALESDLPATYRRRPSVGHGGTPGQPRAPGTGDIFSARRRGRLEWSPGATPRPAPRPEHPRA